MARGVEYVLFLQPRSRRVVYVVTFEFFAIILSTLLLMALAGGPVINSLPAAAAVSVIAILWNYVFNSMWEKWENRRGLTERTVSLRLTHAVGFEAGLFLLIVPLYMLWYGVGVWEATKMEAAILVFFLVYTFVFTWLFDAVFKLPSTYNEA
ncbi:PACE efflux transporter [Aureimonas mangrovi]|uniref:PACE efflux transporter n=1 Tax=Aureimonas mangrovi TaxID=2758041 RepID=UPI00163D8077|nr:PACE efflux transporter [Aureimonas mangrovi]